MAYQITDWDKVIKRTRDNKLRLVKCDCNQGKGDPDIVYDLLIGDGAIACVDSQAAYKMFKLIEDAEDSGLISCIY